MFLYLRLLDLQVFSVLYGEVDVLQHYVNTFFICAVKGQESYHTVVIYLDRQTEGLSK